MMGSIYYLIGTIFDLLNPNFDKNLGNVWIYQNLGLKGQKLIPSPQKMDFFVKIKSKKKNCPTNNQ